MAPFEVAVVPVHVSSLNGLPYKEESYFDFAVFEQRPKYKPGSGPPLAPISVLPPHDKDGLIVEQALVAGILKYVVVDEKNPHLRVSVCAQNILDWVSPRTFEQWESDAYDRYIREREEEELPAILAREAARRKRLEKLSRDGTVKIDGRKKRKIREVDDSREREEDGNESGPPRKRKPGRPSKSSKLSTSTLATPSSGPGRNRPQVELKPYISPRKLSQHSQPSLSQPSLSQPSLYIARGASATIVDSDESDDDESVDTDQALEAQLNATTNVSDSGESISLVPVASRAISRLGPASKKSLNITRDDSSGNSSPRRASLIGGTSSTAATSSREVFSIYESIEQNSRPKPDNAIMLDRSPFKRPIMKPAPQSMKPSGMMLPPRSTRSSSRQDTPSSRGSVRRSERKRSTPPPPAPYIEDEASSSSEEASEYEVETLLDDDIRNINDEKIRHYLVKWVGYSNDQNSWEPAANVGLEAIRDYENRKGRLPSAEQEDPLAQ